MSMTDREILDWLCWKFATDGERFYPPDETAEECIESMDVDSDRKKGSEYGQHYRAYGEAREFYSQMEKRGFDPKARAKRHMDESDLDLEPIDWEWLEGSGDE